MARNFRKVFGGIRRAVVFKLRPVVPSDSLCTYHEKEKNANRRRRFDGGGRGQKKVFTVTRRHLSARKSSKFPLPTYSFRFGPPKTSWAPAHSQSFRGHRLARYTFVTVNDDCAACIIDRTGARASHVNPTIVPIVVSLFSDPAVGGRLSTLAARPSGTVCAQVN